MFPEFEEARKMFREEKIRIAEQMSIGACENHTEYTKMVGIIEGLTRASQLLDNYEREVLSDIDNDDND